MHTLLLAARAKVKRIVIGLDPTVREFRRVWPLVDSIEGWLLESEGEWLFRAVRSLPRGANVVEIGSYKGRSTICLALGCRGGQKRLYTIDCFDGGPDLPKVDSLPTLTVNLERTGLSEDVEILAGLSADVSSKWNKPIHLLYIDGSHSYVDVAADYFGFFPHIVPGGIVAFHDVSENWPGVLKLWSEIKSQLANTGHCEGLGYGQKFAQRL